MKEHYEIIVLTVTLSPVPETRLFNQKIFNHITGTSIRQRLNYFLIYSIQRSNNLTEIEF